jgi:hypothetical protein
MTGGNAMHKDERGDVPWVLDDLLEMFNWYVELHVRSKDDWIFREEGLAVDANSGHTGKWSILSPQDQLKNYVLGQYRDREDSGSAFLRRFLNVWDFLTENEERLAAEPGLCQKSDDGLNYVSLAVFQSLCVLPYSQIVVGDNGSELRKFDYGEVIALARTYPDLMLDSELELNPPEGPEPEPLARCVVCC